MEAAKAGKRRVRRGLLWCGVIAIVLVAFLAIWIASGKSLFPNDPRFVVTKDRLLEGRSGDNLLNRFGDWIWRLQVKSGKTKRPIYSFAPRPIQTWGIDTLLSQCTDITGISYIIPKGVASGTVQFGHTNTLIGEQWVKAVTDALQMGSPEWWDEARTLQKQNLVLVTNDANEILVLTPAMAQDFKR